jgi:hypothetical protein
MTTFAWQFPALEVHPTEQGLTNDAVRWRFIADEGAALDVTQGRAA